MNKGRIHTELISALEDEPFLVCLTIHEDKAIITTECLPFRVTILNGYN